MQILVWPFTVHPATFPSCYFPMRYHPSLPLLLCFFLIKIALSAAVLPPGFVEVPLATCLDPTAMALAPDGRIFITEKYGAVRIVENGQLLPDPFVQLNVDNYNERGLSGIAFDPDFAQNGYIYVYYTVKNSEHNRLSRIKAIGNYAATASEEILLELPPMAGTIHNGGAMAFGPDGKLYLAVGDGQDGAAAPSLQSLLGKVLRLNPDGTVPPGNPFSLQTTGILQSIWAVGLRNPFSMTIQPGTGRIFVCDVGSQYFEEVNHIEAGMHYGWNLLEGQRNAQNVPTNYRDPFYAYPHTLGCSVVGAAFYNPPTPLFPAAYVGQFYFADYCQGYIKMLDPATGILGPVFAAQIDRPLCI
ncbi:MAG: PQQ-dependent sugar dehydrogenase, partial [Saprospiraceae bacterium]|nr:PQQ-dependent sugar dehydrogenase [Saprospiraceae bacterium]